MKYFSLLLIFSLFSIHGFSSDEYLESKDFLWTGFFIAGDDSIPNFDRARETLTSLFEGRGMMQSYQFSVAKKDVEGIDYPGQQSIEESFNHFATKQKQQGEDRAACLFHMTSHGVDGQGFYIAPNLILPPLYLNNLLTTYCGESPTIVLISACYSGQFIEALKAPNRIILTASRHDLPSFGCSTHWEYTFWDNCLIQAIEKSVTWKEASSFINSCVQETEDYYGFNRSYPQSYFGDLVKDFTILD